VEGEREEVLEGPERKTTGSLEATNWGPGRDGPRPRSRRGQKHCGTRGGGGREGGGGGTLEGGEGAKEAGEEGQGGEEAQGAEGGASKKEDGKASILQQALQGRDGLMAMGCARRCCACWARGIEGVTRGL